MLLGLIVALPVGWLLGGEFRALCMAIGLFAGLPLGLRLLRLSHSEAVALADVREERVVAVVERIILSPFRRQRGAERGASALDRRPKRNRRAVALLVPVALSCLSSGSAGKFSGGTPPPPRRLRLDDLTYPFGLDRPRPDLSDPALRLRVRACLRFLSAGGEPR